MLGLRLGAPPLILAAEFLVMGVGTGFANSALTTATVSSVPAAQASQVSSILSAVRQIGVALGIATWGALIARSGEGGPAFLNGLHGAAGVWMGLGLGLEPHAAMTEPRTAEKGV